MVRSYRPVVETLEDRLTPALYGVPWPEPGQLTISFVPDGTLVANGQQSNLFQMLNQIAPTSVWETEILRAFQTWAVNTNINIGIVADSGAPEGATGLVQGDPQFGDIRIASYPLGSDAIAVGMPYNTTAGTWSGDVRLNSNDLFGINPANGSGIYDLYSIMLHEAGHVFGLGHSPDSASPMFEDYLGVRTGLTAGDIADIQALYGPRQPDAYDAAASNDTMATASKLSTSLSQTVSADLTTMSDVDWYSFHPTGSATQVTVTLHTAGISLLTGQLSVYDANGNLLETVASNGPLDGDQTLNIDLSKSGGHDLSTLYFKVEKATDDVFGIGSYQLDIAESPGHTNNGNGGNGNGGNNGNSSNAAVQQGTTPQNAINLQAKQFRSDGLFAYSATGNISSVGTVDYYRFSTPKVPAGQSDVMTITVWGTDLNGLDPVAELFDANGNPVSATVLVNQDGTFTLQLVNPSPNTQYLLAVGGAAGNTGHDAGNYALGINFGTQADPLNPLVTNQVLDPANPPDIGTLQVEQSQMMHFAFSASGTSGSLEVTATDASGNSVFQLTVAAGSTVTTTALLNAGKYTFQFADVGSNNGSTITYSMQVLSISNPVGPEPVDLTLSPGLSVGALYFWQLGLGSFVGSPPGLPPPGGQQPGPQPVGPPIQGFPPQGISLGSSPSVGGTSPSSPAGAPPSVVLSSSGGPANDPTIGGGLPGVGVAYGSAGSSAVNLLAVGYPQGSPMIGKTLGADAVLSAGAGGRILTGNSYVGVGNGADSRPPLISGPDAPGDQTPATAGNASFGSSGSVHSGSLLATGGVEEWVHADLVRWFEPANLPVFQASTSAPANPAAQTVSEQPATSDRLAPAEPVSQAALLPSPPARSWLWWLSWITVLLGGMGWATRTGIGASRRREKPDENSCPA